MLPGDEYLDARNRCGKAPGIGLASWRRNVVWLVKRGWAVRGRRDGKTR